VQELLAKVTAVAAAPPTACKQAPVVAVLEVAVAM
jgi:hypothetical protein